ncbi:MAG: alpha/beta hydrolase [bacterium]|nr:alpha/beta hydrolase [bacterium]
MNSAAFPLIDSNLLASQARARQICLSVAKLSILLLVCIAMLSAQATAADPAGYDRKAKWHGFDQYHFKVAERPAYVVVPKEAKPGNPWIWRARFPGFHAEMDVELVKQGFHIGYIDVAGMLGSPQAMKIGDAFYAFATDKFELAKKPCLEGVSRGGLFVYNWAVKNPEKVACIYCDTPVCDFKSWPGGKGKGLGSAGTWKQCLAAYKFTEAEALAYEHNPVDNAKQIADAKWPLLHIVSETDRVVPPAENTYLLKSRLAKLGHEMEIISVPVGTEKSNGHHFTHPEPDRVVQFILKHASK